MDSTASHDITALLRAWSQGDPGALGSLIPIVEHELRSIAKHCLEARRHDPMLDTSALINEAYLRLIDANQANWQDRAHFFAVCAKIMRRILVDHARARRSAKRGGGLRPMPLDEGLAVSQEKSADLVAIDEALDALSEIDARKGRVVELRFFGGLSVEETAEALSVSTETVQRDWRLARMWLWRELKGDGAP